MVNNPGAYFQNNGENFQHSNNFNHVNFNDEEDEDEGEENVSEEGEEIEQEQEEFEEEEMSEYEKNEIKEKIINGFTKMKFCQYNKSRTGTDKQEYRFVYLGLALFVSRIISQMNSLLSFVVILTYIMKIVCMNGYNRVIYALCVNII